MTNNNSQTALPEILASYINEISLDIDQNALHDIDLVQETLRYNVDTDAGINNYLEFEMSAMKKMIEDVNCRLTEDSYSFETDRKNDEREFYDLTSLSYDVRNAPRNSQKLDLLARSKTN